MARLHPVVLVGVLASACSIEAVTRPSPPPVDWRSFEARGASSDAGATTATAHERAAIDAYLKALASPGFADLGPILDEDAHFTFAGFKDVLGRDNVIRSHQALLGGFVSRAFLASRVFHTDNSQIVEWTMTGTHEASHKPVTIKGLVLLWTRDDGLISDVHLYYDEALANAQLGIGPKALLLLDPPQPPSDPRQEVEQTRSPEEASNVLVVRGLLDALESKNETAYLAPMADDVEITRLEGAHPARGKAEARRYLKAMHKAIAQLDTLIDNIWGVGPFVVAEYHVLGEQRGPIEWIPVQKDGLIKMFAVDVVQLQGGKIVRLWRYDNPAQISPNP